MAVGMVHSIPFRLHWGGTTCWERINANNASTASRSFPCLPRHVYQSQLHVDGKLKCKNCICSAYENCFLFLLPLPPSSAFLPVPSLPFCFPFIFPSLIALRSYPLNSSTQCVTECCKFSYSGFGPIPVAKTLCWELKWRILHQLRLSLITVNYQKLLLHDRLKAYRFVHKCVMLPPKRVSFFVHFLLASCPTISRFGSPLSAIVGQSYVTSSHAHVSLSPLSLKLRTTACHSRRWVGTIPSHCLAVVARRHLYVSCVSYSPLSQKTYVHCQHFTAMFRWYIGLFSVFTHQQNSVPQNKKYWYTNWCNELSDILLFRNPFSGQKRVSAYEIISFCDATVRTP